MDLLVSNIVNNVYYTEKYSNHIGTAGENDGYRSYSILVTDSQSEYTMGYVSLYRTNPSYSFMDEVYIHIDYEDVTNQKKNQNRNMDDL